MWFCDQENLLNWTYCGLRRSAATRFVLRSKWTKQPSFRIDRPCNRTLIGQLASVDYWVGSESGQVRVLLFSLSPEKSSIQSKVSNESPKPPGQKFVKLFTNRWNCKKPTSGEKKTSNRQEMNEWIIDNWLFHANEPPSCGRCINGNARSMANDKRFFIDGVTSCVAREPTHLEDASFGILFVSRSNQSLWWQRDISPALCEYHTIHRTAIVRRHSTAHAAWW